MMYISFANEVKKIPFGPAETVLLRSPGPPQAWVKAALFRQKLPKMRYIRARSSGSQPVPIPHYKRSQQVQPGQFAPGRVERRDWAGQKAAALARCNCK